MPTYEILPGFKGDYKDLSPEEKREFKRAIKKFVEDLKANKPFRTSLRVKGYTDHPGIFEMSWADNGRALFSYGNPVREGETHIIWHAVGGHDIF